MTAAELRARYVRIGFVFYVGWVTVFIIEGFYAVTLPTIDLTLWIDRRIPVISGFVWVYVSCYVFPWILLAVTSNWHRFNLALLAILICTLIAFIGHIAVPVAFTRPSLGSSFSDRFLAFIYENDFKPGAQNFPSLHVAIAWIVAFSSRGNGLSKAAELGILLYAMLIMASTVFIKQHLVLDLVGGTVLAFIAWPLVKRRYDRAIPEGQEPLVALSFTLRHFLPLLLLLVLCLAGVIAMQELFSTGPPTARVSSFLARPFPDIRIQHSEFRPRLVQSACAQAAPTLSSRFSRISCEPCRIPSQGWQDYRPLRWPPDFAGSGITAKQRCPCGGPRDGTIEVTAERV